MAFRIFKSKKYHLGMTGDEVKDALKTAKVFDGEVVNVIYDEQTTNLFATIQTGISGEEAANAAMAAYYDDHDIVIIQGNNVPFVGDIKIQLYKSSPFYYFAVIRLASSVYLVTAHLSIEGELGSETKRIVLAVSMSGLARETEG